MLDIQYFGEDDEFIAVATNSEQVKVIHSETGSSQILYGHTCKNYYLFYCSWFDHKFILSTLWMLLEV